MTLLCFQSPPSLMTNLQSLVAGRDLERDQVNVRQALFGLTRKIEQEDGISVRCEGLQMAFDTATLVDWLTATPTDLLILAKPDDQAAAVTTMSGLSQVIRQTGMPVWFAGDNSLPNDGVVAALSESADGSMDSTGEKRALDFEVMDTARGISRLFDSELHLVQASERPQPSVGRLGLAGLGHVDGASASTGYLPAADENVRELTGRKRALHSFARATGAAEEVDQIVVGMGKTAAVVAARAEALNAGLIIMGAREKSGWETLLKGGTAEATLGLASCDVLYVKAVEEEHAKPQALLTHSALEAEPETSPVDLIVHPRRHFATPLAVLRDDSLSRQTKVLILEAWEEELSTEALQEARMPQQVYELTTTPDELEAVRQTLARLGVEYEAA